MLEVYYGGFSIDPHYSSSVSVAIRKLIYKYR